MEAFCKKWGDFLKIVIDPWLILPIGLAVYLSIEIRSTTDVNIITLLTVLISLFSATAGSIIAKNIISNSSEDALKARGKVSIRSLKLILGNLNSFGRRINMQNSEKNTNVLSTHDIYERITILEEEVLSSIENWTDIIPEADVKTQIGIITKLQNDLEQKEKEKNEIETELRSKSKKSDDEKSQLENKLKEVLTDLKDAEKELHNKTSYLFGSNVSVIGGGISLGSIKYTPPIEQSLDNAEIRVASAAKKKDDKLSKI